LWVATNRIDESGRRAIEDAAAVYVSAATIWEIAIKRASGRLKIDGDPVALVEDSGFARLEITFEHAAEAGQLPPHHQDPFDRMLIAQARLEGLRLMTADHQIKRYRVAVVDVSAAPRPPTTPRPAP
jgi:PIN domain nuclease of toxin-antitoxin system